MHLVYWRTRKRLWKYKIFVLMKFQFLLTQAKCLNVLSRFCWFNDQALHVKPANQIAHYWIIVNHRDELQNEFLNSKLTNEHSMWYLESRQTITKSDVKKSRKVPQKCLIWRLTSLLVTLSAKKDHYRKKVYCISF